MPNSNSPWTSRVFWVLFILSHSAQLALLLFTPLNLAGDEAHYWEWSRSLDFSYYSKGPLVALLIRASTEVFGITEFAVRFPAFVCSLLFSLSLFLFLQRETSFQVAFLTWALYRSMIHFASLSLIITTDPATALLWLWGLMCFYQGLCKKRPSFFVLAFFLVGLGVLAKYTALFLAASVGLFTVFSTEMRKRIPVSSLFLSVTAIVVTLSPILYWNSIHQWVNFTHNAGHLLGKKKDVFFGQYTLELIGGQLGLFGIPTWIGFVWMTFFCLKNFHRLNDSTKLFFISGAPLTLFCVCLSFTKRIYANWPMPIYVSGLLLFAFLLHSGAISWTRIRKWLPLTFSLNLTLLLVAHGPVIGITYGLPAKLFPTKKLVGWNVLGQRVGSIMSTHKETLGNDYVLLSDEYSTASELAFYTPTHPRPMCINITGRRMNQYDLWNDWKSVAGKSAIIITKAGRDLTPIRNHFATLTKLPETLPIYYADQIVREFQFYLGTNHTGANTESPSAF